MKSGDRVRETRKPWRKGIVTFRKRQSARYVYMVRWDGNLHESGEYGIRDLRRHP